MEDSIDFDIKWKFIREGNTVQLFYPDMQPVPME